MKTTLALLLTLLAACAEAQTDVLFTLSDFNAYPATNRAVSLRKMQPFLGDEREYSSSSLGYFYASNQAAGDYAVTIKQKGSARAINFQITVTATNLGVVSAYEITSVSGVATYPTAGKSAWSIAASDARYTNSGASSGTTYTNNSMGLPGVIVGSGIGTNIHAFGALTNNDTRAVTFVDQLTIGTAGGFSGDLILHDGASSSLNIDYGSGTLNVPAPIAATGFAGDGASLTALDGTEITTGTVADARIASTITRDAELTAANTVVSNGVVTGLGDGSFVVGGNGASITNLNADELRSGTVPLARLSGITATQVADASLTTNKVDATFHALLGGGGANNVYDVRDYGADPTGATPSQAAIQAAIDAACVDPSKPVYIPAGTYIMGNTAPKRGFSSEYVFSCLTVWSNNVVIIGDGPTLTILKPGAAFDYQRNFLGVPDRRTLDIASATSSGTTVTLNTTTPHGLAPGDLVDVNNLSPSGYNSAGYHVAYTVVTTPDADTFTYTTAASGMAAATVSASSLVNDMTDAHYLVHENFTMKGIGFDMENRGILTGDNLYDTTQIYNVAGRGVIIDNCHFLRNANNDGIDVQGFDGVWGIGKGNLTVRDCWSAQHGGDALGIQCDVLTLTDTLLEDCGQEGLELNENEDILVNVTVRNCDNVSTLNSYKFTATGCTFIGTNANDHSFDIGAAFTTRHVGFQNCVFDEWNTSTYASMYLRQSDSISIIGCDIRRPGDIVKPFLWADRASSVVLANNTMGRSGWNSSTYDQGVGFTFNGGDDILVSGNTFFRTFSNLVATNSAKRLRVTGNTFMGPVVIADTTNAVVTGNLFYGSLATIGLTNLAYCTFSGNSGLLPLQLGNGMTNNFFVGNSWVGSPSSAYWQSNSVAGDVVTNRVWTVSPSDSYIRSKRPTFQTGMTVYGTGTTDPANPAIIIEEPGVSYGGIGVDSSSMRFSINGTRLWSIGASGNLSAFADNYTLTTTYFTAGNGDATTPAIKFSKTSGDSDTGLYRATTDTFGATTGGTMKWLATPTNTFIPSARIDAIEAPTNVAPADAVVVKRWVRVTASDGQTYVLPGYQ